MRVEGLDEIDNSILEVIRDHARLSFSEIGEQVGLSRVAVKYRMQQMEKMGVIRGYRTEIAPENAPGAVSFFLDLEVDPEQVEDVIAHLAKDSTIRKICLVSGNCRIHASGSAPNQSTLQAQTRFLYRSLKGVRRMSYSLILSTLMDLDGGIEYEADLSSGETISNVK